jgi:cyclic beta-1,2-glucan synthetase
VKNSKVTLGFYQNLDAASSVVNELKKNGFWRIACIYYGSDRKLIVKRFHPALWQLSILVLLPIAIFAAIFFAWQIGVLLAIFGILFFVRLYLGIDTDTVYQYGNRVSVDEVLIIVEVNGLDQRTVLRIMKEEKKSPPLIFFMCSGMLATEVKKIELPRDYLTMARLEEQAAAFAKTLHVTDKGIKEQESLLQQLRKNQEILRFLRHDVAEAEHLEQTITVSADWLLDNTYVINGSIIEIQQNLTKEHYQKLPRISNGPLAGSPRTYGLAMDIVNATLGKVDRDTLTHYLKSYQSVDPLTIAELWAFPLLLRLRLIEWILFLAGRIDRRMRDGELAAFWGDRLRLISIREPHRLPAFLMDLTREQTSPSPHFAEELLECLFDETSVIPLVREWLEKSFSRPLEEVLHEEHLQESSEQVAFSNAIVSLINLSQLSWQVIFEDVCPVDAILKEDPDGTYSLMDFATRNRYRDVIEMLKKRSSFSETEIASFILEKAKNGSAPVERHVGFYLIDKGIAEIEKCIGYTPTIKAAIFRWITSYAEIIHLGAIGMFTLGMESFLITYSLNAGMSSLMTILFALLALIPLSEIAIQLVNFFLTKAFPPVALPKMNYEGKVPKESKTLVVVPILLGSLEEIVKEIDQLEIRYLGNMDPSLCFGIFSDYIDASQRHLKDDEILIDAAVKGIEALEIKYGAGKFFLFHRNRHLCESENAWIGWERKRGKLEILNRFLCGEELTEQIVYAGQKESLNEVKYVITLDADTQLPKDRAKMLIATISHPLNRPCVSVDGKRVVRGYTIIQPRICSDFPHAKITWFTRIFSDPSILDPYTKAISNLYQDMLGEGAYLGKGIYDVKIFNSVLSERFPERHLLSHDLLEGLYVRTGFASDITLVDMFPENYLCFAHRQHRWMRGDWQIIDWLFRKTPLEENPLSLISRWKVFDNLRRSLVQSSVLVLLITGWLFSPLASIWTALIVIFILAPFILSLFNEILNLKFPIHGELKIGLLRSLINIILMPYESFLSLDSIFRVAYRRLVSQRNLLQWTIFIPNGFKDKSKHKCFIRSLTWCSLFSLLVLLTTFHINPKNLLLALPFCLLWALTPIAVYLLDRHINDRPDRKLTEADKSFLRQTARLTWRYFDELVGPHNHWLPPDNYQLDLKIEIAQRTSPTNIGMLFTAIMSAYDLKYITVDEALNRSSFTLKEMKKLERFQGHFLNWYNIETLEPLYPRYISTVDSGNLVACMWTLLQGIEEMVSNPLIADSHLSGIQDTWELSFKSKKSDSKLNQLQSILFAPMTDTLSLIHAIQQAMHLVQDLSDEDYWNKQIKVQLSALDNLIKRYFSWIEILSLLSDEKLNSINREAIHWKNEALAFKLTLKNLASGEFLALMSKLIESSQDDRNSVDIKMWGKVLRESISNAQWLAGEIIGEANEILKSTYEIAESVNLGFLYNHDRKVFAIGYNVDERSIDSSYYDLLASEARIASLTGIAKGDVPLEHWWALGRPYTLVEGRRVLLSWGGTMFEYLMPLIFNKFHLDSLLGDGCKAAVACQIDYGKKRGIPWGISESAYSSIDSNKSYQYRSFGVPGVGMKRGLEEDLVVSPYSSALALAIDPLQAIQNLRTLANDKPNNLLGPYGFYESIDFTQQRGPKGERGVIIYAYMAHHQGMSLASINNTLNNNILAVRFHSDSRISGLENLLYERVPSSPCIKTTITRKSIPLPRLLPFSLAPVTNEAEAPDSDFPKVNLLSNGEYSIMVTNAGGGYSRWRDIDVTRWRNDRTSDLWGSFCYIKDTESGAVWATTYQPMQTREKQYSTIFNSDKAEFKRRDHQIEAITEIVVSPEDNAEIRKITLTNHSSVIRHLEVTSYMELALAAHGTDRSHPCFNKLFIETEDVPDHFGLLAFRRLRSSDDQSIWAAHVVAMSQKSDKIVQFETDRSRFIGRGRSLNNPAALDGNLSNTSGIVLDPIFSLRRFVSIEPGSRVQISFTTAISDNRAGAIALIEKYKELSASLRAIDLSWTYAHLELRHLHVQMEDIKLYQRLASMMLYPHEQLKASPERIMSNRLGQKNLWAYGISGDLPIITVTVGDIYDIFAVKQTIIAHAFWRLRGLKTDLVIINEEIHGYEQLLFEQLMRHVQAFSHKDGKGSVDGVFVLFKSKIPVEDLTLILACSSVVLIASNGALRQQLASTLPVTKYAANMDTCKTSDEEPLKALPFLELENFNGIGGYSKDGRKYAIYLDSNSVTPAPWINVIANDQFGTIVTESGLGSAWYGNSQSNKLTPWSNDPIENTINDCLYIRDEDSGAIWNPTPAPLRESEPYRITHSQGYTRFEHNSHGFEQELLVFVPMNDAGGLPLRIQRLQLTNFSSRRRRLTITSYLEWVLGSDKEETQLHLYTHWDPHSRALLAYNRYHPDYGSHVAFSSSTSSVTSFTGDRTEFIGRNGRLTNPAALHRKELSGKTGTGMDSCAALQTLIEIEPGSKQEIIFILGYAENEEKVRELLMQCRQTETIDKLFNETEAWWNHTLEGIQVDVPDASVNFSINSWLPHQILSSRILGRTAFYQSSGAYGYRDQLQDVMALVYSLPHKTREHILRAAARQFEEGDVQHWWHPASGAGTRSRISDDPLWLPFVTAHYVRTTGDVSILNEAVPFLKGPLLDENQHETYFIPEISSESASLLEHCRRAIHKGVTSGPHGLPLMGGGDWDDGLNLVGIKGKGESVWLAWFIIHVLNDFADLLKHIGSTEEEESYRKHAKQIAKIIEATAWDGSWYRRAYFDDGTPLGTSEATEAIIFSLAQSWAVISGGGDPSRIKIALKSTDEFLIRRLEKIVLLFTPPFNSSAIDPGYIKGYPPGVRENGGQYTHGSLWLAMAYAMQGDGDKAVELLQMMHPHSHTGTENEINQYKVEPYVLAADVYDFTGQMGRGGWTWYTGSAGWMYRIWIEEILGFKLRGNTLSINPTIPKHWNGFKIRYRYFESVYEITFENPQHLSRGVHQEIKLINDGKVHIVRIGNIYDKNKEANYDESN